MPGTGTIINCAAVVAGGILGLLLKKGLPERFQNILICICGLSTLFMGIAGTLKEMFTVENGMLQTHGTLMIIFSLVLGALTGELLNIEKRIEELGEWLKVKSGSSGDTRFMDGFLNTSLTICIGAMAVVGSIQDGLNGDFTTLTAKAILDFIIVVVMTSSLGKGCIFSAIPVGIFQGSINLHLEYVDGWFHVNLLRRCKSDVPAEDKGGKSPAGPGLCRGRGIPSLVLADSISRISFNRNSFTEN